jgi:hypothetical protein
VHFIWWVVDHTLIQVVACRVLVLRCDRVPPFEALKDFSLLFESIIDLLGLRANIFFLLCFKSVLSCLLLSEYVLSECLLRSIRYVFGVPPSLLPLHLF